MKNQKLKIALSILGLSATLLAVDAPPQVPGFDGTPVSSDLLSGTVSLVSGWNLVSSPVNGTVSSSSFNSVASQSGGSAVTWAFRKDGTNYESRGAAVDMEPGRGIWVKADSAQTVSFASITPASSTFSLANYLATLSGAAFMIGTPSTTTLGAIISELSANIKTNSSLWVFEASANNWIGYKEGAGVADGFEAGGYYRGNTSTEIKAGTGFWFIP